MVWRLQMCFHYKASQAHSDLGATWVTAFASLSGITASLLRFVVAGSTSAACRCWRPTHLSWRRT